MTDPLAEVVSLLQPAAPTSKIASGAGRWLVRREEFGTPFFCVVMEGACLLQADGHAPLALAAGDFLLIPAAQGFTMSSPGMEPAASMSGAHDPATVTMLEGETRHGRPDGPADVRILVGYCVFGSPDAALLVSLLPQLVHVRGEPRLSTLVRLVVDECRARRPARDVMLAHLLEALLIEAFRCADGSGAEPGAGLVRALADERLATALRRMHEAPARPWTVAQLAGEAALSRSAFFERFTRALGAAPMEYLLAWRMALAKDLLRRKAAGIAEVAQRVGYGSASAFSVAFARHTGVPPARYVREQAVAMA
jgi:AraC-like DNA-binding protein